MSDTTPISHEAPAISGMTQERSRQIGKALMALAVVQFLFFFGGAVRRSYLVIAVPLGMAVGIASGVLFWVGYTMATKDWDNPADWPPEGNDAGG